MHILILAYKELFQEFLENTVSLKNPHISLESKNTYVFLFMVDNYFLLRNAENFRIISHRLSTRVYGKFFTVIFPFYIYVGLNLVCNIRAKILIDYSLYFLSF